MIERIAIAACIALLPAGAGGADMPIQRTAASIPGDLERQADELEALADAATSNDASEVMPPATAQDIVLACRLAPGFIAAFESGRRKVTTRQRDAMFDLLKKMPWKTLPARARCGSKGIITFQPRGFGEFVTAIARSTDGRRIAIRGGSQLAPLAGFGGECLYERGAARLELRGCVQSYIS